MESLLAKFKGENNKKQIENIVIFIVLLVIIIIVINSLFATDDATTENNEIAVPVSNSTYKMDDAEYKLRNILSCINGVGNVEVMISYSNTIQSIPMYDTKENTTLVEEADVNGGKRTTKETQNEQSIIYEEKNNNKTPAITQTIMPEVVGVIVVADGASNSVVKENVKNAVLAVFDIPSHRIQVFSK